MAHYLTIDQGNTEAKIALWQDTELEEFRLEPALTPEKVSTFVSGRELAGAIYCSVAREDVDVLNRMRHLCPRAMRLTPDTPLPIRIDYRTPTTLGTDRVAAAVGAWSDYAGSPILVVDAGTAVTYDYVDPDGVYHGGNIAPGITMELRALHEFTARKVPGKYASALYRTLRSRHPRGYSSRVGVLGSRLDIFLPQPSAPRDCHSARWRVRTSSRFSL